MFCPYLDSNVKNEDSNYDEAFWVNVSTDSKENYGSVVARTKDVYKRQVINSDKESVVENTLRTLNMQVDLFEAMNYEDGKMVIHIGGAKGGKDLASDRFIYNLKKFPQRITNRLILENDDKTFNAEEVLKICKQDVYKRQVIYGLKPRALKFKNLGFHEIFHIFILLGSLAHFFAVFKYVI